MLFLPKQAGKVSPEWEKIYTNMTLYSLGCPVYKSAVIVQDETIDQHLVNILIDYFQTEEVMIRYQYLRPNSHPIQTGNRYKLSPECISSIQNKDVILWVTEPINRLKNDYGINLLFDMNKCICSVEIVGRGFDASDLTRGRVSPQQTVTTELPVRYGYYNEWWKFLHFKFQTQEEYSESMRLRLKKLREMNYDVSYEIFHRTYVPLPMNLLEELLTYITKLYNGLNNVNCCVASSVYRGKFVFWDIQTPVNKMLRYGI